MRTENNERRARLDARWTGWLLGSAILGAVVVAALHYSDVPDFVRILDHAQLWWLGVALLFQVATYAAQGAVWRIVAARCSRPLAARTAFDLSLAKVFADQALPSAGLSSSALVARALERQSWPPAATGAAVLVNVASYHIAYIAALTAAVFILAARGQSNVLVTWTSTACVIVSGALSGCVVALAGRPPGRLPRILRALRVDTAIGFLASADRGLVRSSRVLVQTSLLQLAIFLLDAATVWMLIAALGEWPSVSGVFASFMVASVFRTMGVVPGGLGTFEAASVLMLRMVGVQLGVALSATLLFRGLSFWLPMLPGFWSSRRVLAMDLVSDPEQFRGFYWSLHDAELTQRLNARCEGLSPDDAERRLLIYGLNTAGKHEAVSRLSILVRQLRSPLLLLLVFAAGASVFTGEWLDAVIVLTIVIASVAIGYSREYAGERAAAALRARLRTLTTAIRAGTPQEIPIERVVPGDVVLVRAGDLVPADARVLASTDCYVSEAALTGESFPVLKAPGVLAADVPLRDRTNCVFQGTNVRSGTARCLVVRTGRATEFGLIAETLTRRPPETEFDRGVRHFGYSLTTAMLILVLAVFAVHAMAGRPPMETLLFAIALAVGLSPELLPAILNVNLARGAQAMAHRGVLVRRLNAIENLGSMDVLCTDKTGTITEGIVQLEGAFDCDGRPSPQVLEWAACNAALETGIASALDEAIQRAHTPDLTRLRKSGEVPFDFVRKRVTVALEGAEGTRLLMKGAFDGVLDACTSTTEGLPLDASVKEALRRQYGEWSACGIRVLAVAIRCTTATGPYSRDDEHDMAFAGFLTFSDRPKEGAAEAIAALSRLGVSIKMITGDNALVAAHVAKQVGLRADRVLSGHALDCMHDDALWRSCDQTDVFAEVDPNQKERIILSLKRAGHVVGFLGDGVNDAPAMHAADTSMSVDKAVDVAREAADFVLLDRSLDVIRHGIEEGRTTFANTLKYILITTSANLGNMLSMAVASLWLPFLPLTAGQILLNNFVSDIPAVGIADDDVDEELIARPRRWDMAFIQRFMIEFGLLSSVFDLLTFGTLLAVFHVSVDVFRTSWFVESLLTELVVALVVRTRRPLFRSRPGRLLLTSTIILIPVTYAIPYAPFATLLGFVRLSLPLLAAITGITLMYVLATELLKHRFYTKHA